MEMTGFKSIEFLVEHSLSLARNVIATFDLHGNHSTFEDYYAQSFPRLFQIMPFSSSFGFFITVSKGELLCVVAFLLDSVWTGNSKGLLAVPSTQQSASLGFYCF